MEGFISHYPFLVITAALVVLSVAIASLLTSKGFFEGHEFRGIQGLIFLIILYLIVAMELIMLIAPMGSTWQLQQLWLLVALAVSALGLRSINQMLKRRAQERAYSS